MENINNDFKSIFGNISITSDGYRTYFSDLTASYPLKLIAPTIRSGPARIGICYSLQYGGGLVAGDICNLGVKVQDGSTLLLLTQGSTKVFKSDGIKTSQQKLSTTVDPGCMIISLPDPVQPFAQSRYKQKQNFYLHSTSSAVILDAFSSGRSARGESWQFDTYTSINNIYIDDVLIIRDAQTVAKPDIEKRMGPFHVYGLLILLGKQTEDIRRAFEHAYDKQNAVLNGRFDIGMDVLWSYTPINKDASVIRLAGKDEEVIKLFLRDNCINLQEVIGMEAYVRCFK
ncbi:UreD-domain-containing protein [Wallemia mellicola]|uniref:UreD-domain-containing protein n=1 Tax=Wallemia mellicola TaxID=1708541 RepID=A0A4T0MD19_9BASI|nr:UreD-domain-containing protein [Wallemia mellicola]TIC02859.1 UreD-domain-containing protein [Wallemia mellicola]